MKRNTVKFIARISIVTLCITSIGLAMIELWTVDHNVSGSMGIVEQYGRQLHPALFAPIVIITMAGMVGWLAIAVITMLAITGSIAVGIEKICKFAFCKD